MTTSARAGGDRGRIVGIWLKPAHRAAMEARPRGELVAGQGLAGNVDRSRRRQVTLLEHEVWERVTSSLGVRLEPSARRANLVVSGIPLARSAGAVLRIGGARLLVVGELTPCSRMDEACPGLQAALGPEWRGGVFAQVLEGGAIAVGDAVAWDVVTPVASRPSP